jgi:hypothetical protein
MGAGAPVLLRDSFSKSRALQVTRVTWNIRSSAAGSLQHVIFDSARPDLPRFSQLFITEDSRFKVRCEIVPRPPSGRWKSGKPEACSGAAVRGFDGQVMISLFGLIKGATGSSSLRYFHWVH